MARNPFALRVQKRAPAEQVLPRQFGPDVFHGEVQVAVHQLLPEEADGDSTGFSDVAVVLVAVEVDDVPFAVQGVRVAPTGRPADIDCTLGHFPALGPLPLDPLRAHSPCLRSYIATASSYVRPLTVISGMASAAIRFATSKSRKQIDASRSIVHSPLTVRNDWGVEL